jgi:predicted enzyme related to lactoylglutathione lyase
MGTPSRLEALLDAGAELRQQIRDVCGGTRIASVTDLDGTVIGLLQSP